MKNFNFLIAVISFMSITVFAQKQSNSSLINSNVANCNTSLPVNIVGETLLCDSIMHSLSKYKIGQMSDVNSYNWVLPQGMMIVSGQGTNSIIVSIDYSFSGGDVSVSGSTICGTTTATRSLYVSIVPPAPSFNFYKDKVMADEEYEFSVQKIGSVDYIWTVPYGAIIVSGQGTSSIKVKFSESFVGGDIEVYAENSCAAGPSSIATIAISAATSMLLYENDENVASENNELALSTELIKVGHSRVYNYPNPVSSATRFHVELGDDFSQTESININIFDLKGQMVKSINVNNNNGQGNFSESWNAADESANALSAGVYFYNVIAEDNSGKMHSIRANSNIQILR